jgi:hypothetical protein
MNPVIIAIPMFKNPPGPAPKKTERQKVERAQVRYEQREQRRVRPNMR